MGRTELISRLAKRIYENPSTKEIQQCAQFCDTLVDIITDSLVDGEKILWKGFLSAEVVERDATKRRNPQTGEIVTYPPVKTITCKLSKTIKDAVKGK